MNITGLKETRRRMLRCSAAALIAALAACNAPKTETADAQQAYHFDRPADMWEATFPLGNGRLGMTPDGGIDRENIVLNEISMWSGSKQDTDNPEAVRSLPEIRRLLFEGKNDEAQELVYRTFVCKGEGSGQGNGANKPYGCYQLLGNLVLQYKYADTCAATDYRRELRLDEAAATVSFRRGATTYRREAFTSFAGDVGVIRLTADTDRALSFSIAMNRPEHYAVRTDGGDLVMAGQLPDGVDTVVMRGNKYAARVRVVLPRGGMLQEGDGTLTVSNASEAILLVSMATSYKNAGYEEMLSALLAEAEKKDYATLKGEHTDAFRSLFSRVSLDLGSTGREGMPMDERLAAFRKDRNDPSLASLYFRFGRYLLISSTRPGSLPPNLQGLWCNTIQTPWNGDYHLNINLQMNLWPAEPTNLSELHLPAVEWIKQQVKSGERTARVFYNARGWVTHILGNVWEFTAPGEHPSWGATNTSAAWLCRHLYEHYLYTGDKEYLREVYPVMKGAALFFTDMLVRDPRTGYLVTAPTTSPENAFIMPGTKDKEVHICAGSTMDNQIVRELFTSVIAAAGILGTDDDLCHELADKRSQLRPTTIGSDGRIMEWAEPYREADPHHRHVSHLYGLHPGTEISVEHSPALAEAARKTLMARGDRSTGWSMAWKILFWARLRDGEHAFALLTDLLRPCVDNGTNYANGGGTYPNLFCAHPPFQIDGNFGSCAGIAEMLLQSHEGYINLLPALPAAWKDGSFRGLRVQGGGEVSARWKDCRLTEAELKAVAGGSFRIKLPENTDGMRVTVNGKAVSLPIAGGALTADLNAGDILRLAPCK